MIEVSCPLPFDSYSFANTMDLPPTAANYSVFLNCTWSNAVLHFSTASNGSQYDHIAAVWLSGAEILRTSTPEPTPDRIFWTVHKDVTRYSALIRRPHLNLSVMLENLVDDVYTGIYRVNITLHFYNVAAINASTINRRSMKSSPRKLKQSHVNTYRSSISNPPASFSVSGMSLISAAFSLQTPPNATLHVIELEEEKIFSVRFKILLEDSRTETTRRDASSLRMDLKDLTILGLRICFQ